MVLRFRPCALALLATLAGCTKAPAPEVPPKPAAAVVPDAKAQPEPAKPPPLSAEDIRLIEADPKDLTVEERRKRAYALRRKIMQNPDSPAARTLTDLAKAAEKGEIDPGGKGQTLHLPGTKPTGSGLPAGVRPQDVEKPDTGTAPPTPDAP